MPHKLQHPVFIILSQVIANKDLWAKLAWSQCWTKYEEENRTGLDIQ